MLPDSEYTPVGRTIVIHADADDLGTGTGDDLEGSQATGNAGARIGCCVIEAIDNAKLPIGARCDSTEDRPRTGRGVDTRGVCESGCCGAPTETSDIDKKKPTPTSTDKSGFIGDSSVFELKSSATNPIVGGPWEVCMESSKVATFVPPLNWYKYNSSTEATYIKTAGFCRKSGVDASTQIVSTTDVVDLISRSANLTPKVTLAECQATCDVDPLCTHFDWNNEEIPDLDGDDRT